MEQQLALVEEDDLEVVKRTIVLPYLAYSKNVWEGWQPMWKSGARKKWQKAIAKQIHEQQFPESVRCAVHARLIFASNRRRDWQNYVHPLWYFVADALVQEGVLPDDTPDRFQCGPNGGIEFVVDSRTWVPKEHRQRTVIGFALEI